MALSQQFGAPASAAPSPNSLPSPALTRRSPSAGLATALEPPERPRPTLKHPCAGPHPRAGPHPCAGHSHTAVLKLSRRKLGNPYFHTKRNNMHLNITQYSRMHACGLCSRGGGPMNMLETWRAAQGGPESMGIWQQCTRNEQQYQKGHADNSCTPSPPKRMLSKV